MTSGLPSYPVSETLGALSAALADGGMAVLSAPPGAGKTTTLFPYTTLFRSRKSVV